jgi:hypothetical protein
MKLTREAAERAMTAFAVVAANGNSREAESCCRLFLIARIGQLPKEGAMSTTAQKKMDASKENAAEAQRRLNSMTPTNGVRTLSDDDFEFLSQLIEAAHKRLPSHAAIAKDKLRKKNYHKNKNNAKKPDPVPA